MPYTVTQRIRAVEQPAEGYIPISKFSVKKYEDFCQLHYKENISANYVGLAVDYLTRFYVTKNVEEAFDISMLGAKILREEYGMETEYQNCLELLEKIQQGDVFSAVQLVAYDEVYRAGIIDIPKLEADKFTIENIKIMVNRGVRFLKNCGKEIKSGLDFEGGYTDVVVNGDCDYLTENALIDFKVIRGEMTTNYSLQILMYYLMGLRSENKKYFEQVKWLALFNPRKNIVYFVNVKKISESVIEEVSKKVIGYKN